MFSILSVPIYRLLCDNSFVAQFYYFDTLVCPIFSSCPLHIMVLEDPCFYISNFSTMSYSMVFRYLEMCKFEFAMALWFFLPALSNYDSKVISSFLYISLYVRRSKLGILEFYSLQHSLCVAYEEITLAFFRIYNPTHYSYTTLFVYLVYPLFSSVYVNKVQCFCFESVIIRPLETFDLPVLFYISLDLRDLSRIVLDKLAFLYVLFIV